MSDHEDVTDPTEAVEQPVEEPEAGEVTGDVAVEDGATDEVKPPTPIDPEAPPGVTTEEETVPVEGEAEDQGTVEEEAAVAEVTDEAVVEPPEEDAGAEITADNEAPAADAAVEGVAEAPAVEEDSTEGAVEAEGVPVEAPADEEAPTEEVPAEDGALVEVPTEEVAVEVPEEGAATEATTAPADVSETLEDTGVTETAADAQTAEADPPEAPAEAPEGAPVEAPVEAPEEATVDPPAADAPAELSAAEAPVDAGMAQTPAAATDAPTETADASTERVDQVPEVDPQGVSPRSQFPPNATATVKFILMPVGQVVTLAHTLSQTVLQCKDHFSAELKIPTATILILLDGKSQDDCVSIGEMGVQPNGTIQLEVQSADPNNLPLGQYRPRDDYHMPDVISVRVQLDNGDYKDVVVEISRPTKNKPYLGGYRHKRTGVEFHHAAAQTVAKPPPPPLCDRNCRETQTVEQRQRLQQTTNNMSTQMTGVGVYVSNMTDKLLIPGRYVTAEERSTKVLKKVVTVQKYFRRWYARRYVSQVRADRDKRLAWEREEEERKRREKEERIKREFERRMNPKTKEDFDLLYHALEKWRLEEVELIDQTLSGAERKAALCQLLEQETQLIASIGRNKLEADSVNNQKRIQRFLGKAAAPKRWKGRDGKYTEMDTPYTIRARELMDIYNSVTMKYLTQDERLDVLLTLKHTVKEHDCKLTQELIDLIDREADLLMRGVKEAHLEGLRKRIATLFLQYIKTPTFNPEITQYLKVPQDPSSLRNNIYFCSSCNQYFPSTEFHLATNERTMGKCRRCCKVDNEARVRQDYSYYRHMLVNLRKAEEQFDDQSKIAFLMQEGDLRYLVENVWSSQSMLSAWDDLYDLELVRWDLRDEWAPWNSILLTREEAAAHAKLENLTEGYGQVFIHKVQQKHTLARNYFSRLPGMAQLMREKDNEEEKRKPSISGKGVAKRPSVQASA